MPEIKKKHKRKNNLWLIFPAAVAFVALFAVLLHGKNVALLNPKGLVSQDQSRLILFTIALLLLIAVPTVIFLFYTAWTYRESNEHANYDPDKKHGKLFVCTIWMIPSFFMLILAFVLWNATHKLVPQKPIASSAKPLVVQVVAMRWKWLFLYPEQDIATVNYVQLPVERPVEFELTADDAPMSSFWIPNLGGQLYAMTGMENKLNLMPDTLGSYPGSTAEINGAGFAGMQFTTKVSSSYDFENWVQGVKQTDKVLDDASYGALLKPSENNTSAFYSSSESSLYDKVLMKYMAPTHDNSQMTGTQGMQMMGME